MLTIIQKKQIFILLFLICFILSKSNPCNADSAMHTVPKNIHNAIQKNTRQSLSPTIPGSTNTPAPAPAPNLAPSPQYRPVKPLPEDTSSEKKIIRPQFVIQSPFTGAVTSAIFSQDGKWLATGSENGSIHLWNLTTGQRDKEFQGESSRILSVAFLSGNKILAAGSENGNVSLRHVVTGDKIALFQAHAGQAVNIVSDNKGDFLITAGNDGVKLWDIQKGVRQSKIFNGQGPVLSLAVDRNGKRLATGGRDGRILIREWQADKTLFMFENPEGAVHSVSFSPDNRYLAAGLEDGTVRIWNLSNRKEIFSKKEHQGIVRSVAFSPKENFFAGAGDDKTVCIWSVPDGKLLHRISGHQNGINTLCFTPDGRHLLTASNDHTARFWECLTGKELARLITMGAGWAVVSPEGYFDGTLDYKLNDRLDAIQWRVGDRSFSVSNFTAGYYMPALLGRLLTGKDMPVQKKLPNISEGFDLPPGVRITSPEKNSTVNSSLIYVKILATDQGGGIDSIRLFHNGKVLDDTKAENQEKSGKQITMIYPVNLTQGKNILRAVGLNRDRTEGEPDETGVSYNPLQALARPVLHVVAIGINLYKNSSLNLDFCVL